MSDNSESVSRPNPTRVVDNMGRLVRREWPTTEQFEADAATVLVAAITGRKATFVAPDEEYAERVYRRAERIGRLLGVVGRGSSDAE